MDISVELRRLSELLNKLRKESKRLFAAQVELRLNHQLMEDKLEEICVKNQELRAFQEFLSGEDALTRK